MVVVRIYGGLGNQFFQYALGRNLASLLKTDLVIDTSWYKKIPKGDTVRIFELSRYKISGRYPKGTEAFLCLLYGNRLLRKIPFIFNFMKWHYIKEKNFLFDENILKLKGNLYLDGYWQSFKYFDQAQKIIRNELVTEIGFSELDNQIIKKIKKHNSVSIHIRRGDYVNNKQSFNVHGVCSLDYYNAAISLILSKVQNPYFFIFSDDLVWAKQNLSLPSSSNVVFVDHNNTENAFQDMRLMSMCHHNIIANSTFSWWAAWLNLTKEKIVIAPQQWFANKTLKEIQSLFPLEWILL